MKWSKLKQRIEANFSDAVRGRVEVWATRYRSAHDEHGEAWVTIDKKRVHSMGTLTSLKEFHLASERRHGESNGGSRSNASEQADTRKQIEKNLQDKGALSQWEFNDSLFNYLNMSIDDILASDQMIIRAFGMLDKRLGKRRIKSLNIEAEEPLVRLFYDVRCTFEGITR